MSSDNKGDTTDDLVSQVEKLGIQENEEAQEKGEKEEIPADIKKVAQWIRDSKKVMILSGAGVSVAAGIPDFRTPGTGLYDNLQAYNLPYPEAVFVLDFYRNNPHPFLRLAREIWPGLTHSPTLTHSFMSLLHEKQERLLRVYTQNIDGLEYLAGIPSDQILECHGHFRTASCIDCHKQVKDMEAYRDQVLNKNKDDVEVVPKCEHCGGLVKPDIVFFGESLPVRFNRLLGPDCRKADLLLIMGTSLQVAPVNMIPEYVDCRRVLINLEDVGDFNYHNGNDIFLEGPCDDTIVVLAKALGWEDELRAIHSKHRIGESSKKDPGSDE